MSQITTARKAVTLLLSYLIFTKPLTEQHATGLLLIAMGITMKIFLDDRSNKKALNSSPIANIPKPSEDKELMAQSDYAGEHEERRPLV